jgi:hypothetical protein
MSDSDEETSSGDETFNAGHPILNRNMQYLMNVQLEDEMENIALNLKHLRVVVNQISQVQEQLLSNSPPLLSYQQHLKEQQKQRNKKNKQGGHRRKCTRKRKTKRKQGKKTRKKIIFY